MIRETPADPAERARHLADIRDALRSYETSELAGVAATLAETAECLAKTAKDLQDLRPGLWVDREGLRKHLACRTESQFAKIAAEVPHHRWTDRVYLYNVLEVDEWLMSR